MPTATSENETEDFTLGIDAPAEEGTSDEPALAITKVGTVAPFINPQDRLGRRLKVAEWRRRGFVPLTPGRPKLRHRILPRTVIGISFMLLTAGVAAAFAGAAFYAYYDNRLAENEKAVSRFVENFDQQFTDASGALDTIRVQSVEEIRAELSPLGDYIADANGVINLPRDAGPSIWQLTTADEDGEPVSGSAFAIVGHQGGTAFVTNYSLVASSTQAPSPSIELIKGGRRLTAQLWSWDEDHDLALITVDEEVPRLELASDEEQDASIGARLFALSGVGGQGATASPGVLLDASDAGLQHTAPVGTLFRGGPLLNGDGKVVGVASLSYQPLGVDPGAVGQAPDVDGLCDVVLACSEVRQAVTVEIIGAEAEGADADESVPVGETETLVDNDGEVIEEDVIIVDE